MSISCNAEYHLLTSFSEKNASCSNVFFRGYSLNFNIEKNIITRNSIKVYRPLHCWEFSFNYWPRGLSSGFSLEIKVKNPKLQDIKVLSSDANRGFSSY